MEIKAEFFLSAGSIGRNRNWGFVKHCTSKRIYERAAEIIAKNGTRNVSLGFTKSDPARIQSIVINF